MLVVTKSETAGVTLHFRFQLPTRSTWIQQVKLLAYLVAVAFAVVGNSEWQNKRDFASSESWLWMALIVWLLAEAFDNRQQIKFWWRGHDRLGQVRWLARILPLLIGSNAGLLLSESMSAGRDTVMDLLALAFGRVVLAGLAWLFIELAYWRIRIRFTDHAGFTGQIAGRESPSETKLTAAAFTTRSWRDISDTRIVLCIAAIAISAHVWTNTAGNLIEPPIMLLWVSSAVLWGFVFSPLKWNVISWARGRIVAWHNFQWQKYTWVIVAFLLIMILAAAFRLTNLQTLPREMYIDQTVILEDAHRVFAENYYPIQFSRWGEGRDPLHTYFMLIFSSLPGLGLNHFTLKLLAAFLSLCSLPVLFFFGIEIIGDERRKLGIIVGLLLTGLVAVSYWHAILAREALRITLMPVFVPLTLIWLARAMRHNRRSDYILLALALGFGLYAYKVMRFMPIVIVAGILLAIMVRRIAWRERLKYLMHLGMLAFIAFMVFLPYFHLSLDDPEMFWWTEGTKVFGYGTTPEDQAGRFSNYIPELMSNIKNVFHMFHWNGDISWHHSMPGKPALDVYTGAFLIVGAAAWLVFMLKSRDTVVWFLPLALLILLMPSALSIAAVIENPSNTRTSGAMALVYLLAAYPLALISFHLWQTFNNVAGRSLAIILCAAVILLANQQNTQTVFVEWNLKYHSSLPPVTSLARYLRGVAESDGAYGNTFFVHCPCRSTFERDHIKIPILTEQYLWNNYTHLPDLPRFLYDAWRRSGEYALQLDRDVLVFYSSEDEEAAAQLRAWFPNGRSQEILSDLGAEEVLFSYMAYRVPAFETDGFSKFLLNHDLN